jgi:hypothetical protein
MFNLFASGADPATINEGDYRWPNDPNYFDDFSSSEGEEEEEEEEEDEAVNSKPKAKSKGCKEDKHGDCMDSDDEDDEGDANSPTKGKNMPAARRGGRAARNTATKTSGKQLITDKATGSQLTSILTPTKRKVSTNVSTPTKRPRKKPTMIVKRGSRSSIDAPAYNIKLPNVTITTIEILTQVYS